MNESILAQKDKFLRFQEILDIGKQRYVEAGGEPQRYRAGFKGEDFLSDAERQEAAEIMHQMFGISVQNGVVNCQGRSWELPSSAVVEAQNGF
jgi:hypothetical protein